MAKTDDREKMLEEVFSKRRSFSNIYNDSVDILKDTESELNKILMQNQKDLEEMTKNFHYSDEDLKWVENAVCMRSAGVPVEMLIEYVKLFQQGDSTIAARRDLLMEARAEVQKNLDKYQATMDRLNYKISRYEEAVKTGVLSWEAENIKKD